MEPKKKAVDLAIIFGGKPGKGSPRPGPSDTEDREPTDDTDDDELPPDFEQAAIEAFPDLEGDTDRLKALKRAIHACTDSY